MKKRGSTFSSEIQKMICNRYNRGETTTFLSKEYGCSKTKILQVLKCNRILTRNRSEQKRIYNLNENVFNELNENSLYWLGFIAADGNLYINSRGTKNLQFGLHQKDEDQIDKMKCFFGTKKPTYYYKSKRLYKGKYIISPEVKFNIISKKIFDDICSYGIMPKKTFNMEIDGRLMNKHFFRGLFDGDGSIYSYENANLQACIVGIEQVLTSFKIFLEQNIGLSFKLSPCKNIYRINWYGEKAIKVLNLLYEDSNIYLNRKYDLYKRWKEKYGNRRKIKE